MNLKGLAIVGFWTSKEDHAMEDIFTDPIPGTDLQICYGELDNPDIMEKMKAYMVPNAAVNGIGGIKEATVKGNFPKKPGYIFESYSLTPN